jgi:hypothetical protein
VWAALSLACVEELPPDRGTCGLCDERTALIEGSKPPEYETVTTWTPCPGLVDEARWRCVLPYSERPRCTWCPLLWRDCEVSCD